MFIVVIKMKIGDQVTSKIYSDYGTGQIVGIEDIGEEIFYKVFFEDKKEVMTLGEDSLSKFTSSIDRMKNRDLNDSILFKLCLLSEKINELSYQGKIISANNFNILALPHQILTVNRVIEDIRPRYLIADEVGLGKTIEAILIFEELKLRGIIKRAIIITPSGLTSQWKDELKTKFDEDFVLMNRETFKGLHAIHDDKNVWLQNDFVISSIDFVKPKAIKDSLSEKVLENRMWHNKYVCDDLVDAEWDMIIVDEAHNLTKDLDTSETARYKIINELAKKIDYLLFLTATPHQGKSERFRYLLELIDPFKFFDKKSLTPENVESVTIKNEKRAVTDLDGKLIFKDRIVNLVKIYRGEEDKIEKELYDKVSDYVAEYHYIAQNSPILRFVLITYQKMVSSSSRAVYESLKRRYDSMNSNSNYLDVLEEVDPDDIEDLDVQVAYDSILNYAGKKFEPQSLNINKLKPHIAKELTILEECVNLAKQASTGRQDTKIRKLLEIIDEVIERDGLDTKFIIFTEFIETQNYVGEILEDFGYKVTYFNGRMGLEDKIKNKSKFKGDYQFLISTDAGGEGINLQFAHVMINYDLPWNPMKIEQRIGRIDRIGQTKDVLVFNFVIEDTIEEHIRDILDSKLDIISDEFGDDKKRDVLSLLNEEFNFDKIFIEAVRRRKVKEKEFQDIGNQMYNKAKDVIESQQLLIPFESEEKEPIKDIIIKDERILIENLIRLYLKYKKIDLFEYTNDKNVFYIDKSINGVRYRYLTFDKKIALENEKYNYVCLSHNLVNTIIDEVSSKDSLSFDLKISNYGENVKGTLFLYKLEITNYMGFNRRHLIPIFIDDEDNYNEKASNWFLDNINLEIDIDFREDIAEDIENIKLKAEKIKIQKINEHLTNARFDLMEKLDEEKQKYDKYFENERTKINKRGIENIKTSLIQKLEEHREKIELDRKKRNNLAPQPKLLAVAEITLQ